MFINNLLTIFTYEKASSTAHGRFFSRSQKNQGSIFYPTQSIDWSAISNVLDHYYQRGNSVAGRPSYPGLILFKMSLLQTWYGLSDYEVEDRVNDSISFSRFVGLSLEDQVPDHSALSRFRSELTSKGAYDQLLISINQQLEKHHIMVRKGAIIDASIVDTALKPKGHPYTGRP